MIINGETEESLYWRCLNKWKFLAQERMIYEEMGELLSALGKYHRGRATVEEVMDEIVDVDIMISQLRIMLDIDPDLYDQRRKSKLERLQKRVNDETHHRN